MGEGEEEIEEMGERMRGVMGGVGDVVEQHLTVGFQHDTVAVRVLVVERHAAAHGYYYVLDCKTCPGHQPFAPQNLVILSFRG